MSFRKESTVSDSSVNYSRASGTQWGLNEDLIHLLGSSGFKYFPSSGAKLFTMAGCWKQFKGPAAFDLRNGDILSIGCNPATMPGKLWHIRWMSEKHPCWAEEPGTREHPSRDSVMWKSVKGTVTWMTEQVVDDWGWVGRARKEVTETVCADCCTGSTSW